LWNRQRINTKRGNNKDQSSPDFILIYFIAVIKKYA
jgi:hypothetical protein